MALLQIDLNFDAGEVVRGNMQTATGMEVAVGDGGLYPYDMLLGALGACFYYNFKSISSKMKVTYESLSIRLTGEKRTEVPATLAWGKLEIRVKNPSDVKSLDKIAELSGKYCSVYQTVGSVAELSLEVIVE